MSLTATGPTITRSRPDFPKSWRCGRLSGPHGNELSRNKFRVGRLSLRGCEFMRSLVALELDCHDSMSPSCARCGRFKKTPCRLAIPKSDAGLLLADLLLRGCCSGRCRCGPCLLVLLLALRLAVERSSCRSRRRSLGGRVRLRAVLEIDLCV